MFCNWIASYEPATVTIDPERGSEPGISVRVTSDWDDDFIIESVELNGYSTASEWCRAPDAGIIPDYFTDFIPDLAVWILSRNYPAGVFNYQVDLATRTGNQTARELWALENP